MERLLTGGLNVEECTDPNLLKRYMALMAQRFVQLSNTALLPTDGPEAEEEDEEEDGEEEDGEEDGDGDGDEDSVENFEAELQKLDNE